MAPIGGAKQKTLGGMVAGWWREWRQQRIALAELEYCGSEAERIARDVGLAPAELRVIAAKRPDAADLLPQRLAALQLDAGKIAFTEGAVLRDLQRVCTACDSKGRCARDLACNPSSSDWRDYCPNSDTLSSLVTEVENEKGADAP